MQSNVVLRLDSLLCHSRTALCVLLFIEHVLDRLANKDRAVDRRESANFSPRSLVDPGHLSLRVDLGGANIVCGLRKEHIHLYRISYRGRAFRAHVNTTAADVAGATFAALQDPAFIAPGEDHRQTQTKTLGVPSICSSFFHNACIALQTAVSA